MDLFCRNSDNKAIVPAGVIVFVDGIQYLVSIKAPAKFSRDVYWKMVRECTYLNTKWFISKTHQHILHTKAVFVQNRYVYISGRFVMNKSAIVSLKVLLFILQENKTILRLLICKISKKLKLCTRYVHWFKSALSFEGNKNWWTTAIR